MILKQLIEKLKANSSYVPESEVEKALLPEAIEAIEAENAKAQEEQLNKFGEKIAEMVSKAVTDATEKMAKSSKAPQQPEGDYSKLSKEERIAKFFNALVKNDEAVVKSLAEGADSEGGYIVPTEFRADIVRAMADMPVIRSRASIFPMSGMLLELPAVASEVQVSWGTENQSMSSTTAVFGNVTLTAHRLNAILRTSRELVNDASIAVVKLITDMFAKAVSKAEDKAFTTGSGTGQPKGLTQETLRTVDFQGGNLVDQVNSMYWRLGQAYRDNAAWLMNSRTIEVLTAVKDNNGAYMIQTPAEGGTPTLKGRPVLEQNDLSSNVIFFGDLKTYFIGDREQMAVETSTQEGNTWVRHQVAIKVYERVDGKLALTQGFIKGTNVPVS